MSEKKWKYIIPKDCNNDYSYIFNNKDDDSIVNRIHTSILEMPFRYPIQKEIEISDIPDEWSWRKIGTNKIEKGGIRNQGVCGGSWAFSIASSLGDRYAIKYNIAAPYPSPLWLISNYFTSNKNLCARPGNIYMASKFLEKNGIKLETCWPYNIVKDHGYISPESLEKLPDNCCFNCCDDNIKKLSEIRLFCKPESLRYIVKYNKNENSVNLADQEYLDIMHEIIKIDIQQTIKEIQNEIMNNGPVVSTFAIYDDFINYWVNDAKNGKIYTRKSDKNIGGHSVVLTGWGIENGIKYWEVRNSWGNKGDEGYCKIAFSTNTPRNKWIYIDIPLYDTNKWYGGVIAFEPGKLINKEYFKSGILYENQNNLYTENPTDVQNSINEKIEEEKIMKEKTEKEILFEKIIFYISIGVIILLVIFIIYKIFKISKRKNKSILDIKTNDKISYNKINNINLNNNIKPDIEYDYKKNEIDLDVPIEYKNNFSSEINKYHTILPY